MNNCFADDVRIEDYSSTIIGNKNGSNTYYQSQLHKKSPNNTPRARKHAFQNSEVEEPLRKKKKLSKGLDTAAVILNSAAHNSPVAILNKIIQNLNYRIVSQSGPSHCAKFTISVQVNGQHFTGSGSSKKAAKAAAAYKALTAMKHPVTESLPACDFTSDDDLSSSPLTKDGKNFEDSLVNCGDSANNAISAAPLVVKSASLVASKSPINIIYESYPDAIFHCTSVEFGTDSANRRYKVICEISGRKFEGHGSSKKSAKLGASKSAIAALGNPNGLNNARMENSLPKYSPNVIPPISSGLPQTLADQISKLVIDKFNDLLQSDPIHIRRKVLAGIVMTYGDNYQHVEVLTVSSGTKCVSGDRLSTSGLVVNDCHAEVVSRRCFQDFLYGCLEEIANTPDGIVGDSNPLRPATGGGYRFKESYRFHLYISTAPCGDARIFSPHEEACLPPDRHPNRQARGQLRTKIESGEGTIPVKSSGGIQTWDGVLLGERLLTMSCSDKVCRWNVLGVQGALLSLFLPPIYLQSIVLGSLLHPHHLNRAVCGRLVGVLKELAPPFHINRPLLAQSSSAEQRNAMRAPSFSVNWTKGQQAKEVINAVTGKTELGKPSRLCKQNMFRRWTQLVPHLSALPQVSAPSPPALPAAPEESLSSIGYDLAKSKALLYQNSKLSLFKAFQKANLGNWLKKPIEQDQFHKVDCDNN